MSEQPNQPVAEQPAAQPSPASNGASSEARFTQADIDRIAGETRKSARQAAINDLIKELGVENADALKVFVEDARKRQESELTETQRLAKQLEDTKKQADGYRAQVETMLAQAKIDKRNAALVKAAEKARAEAPDDVILWAEKYAADDLGKVMGDDGKIDDKAVAALIERCRKERKSWFGGVGPGSPSNQGGTIPTPDVKKSFGDAPLFKW